MKHDQTFFFYPGGEPGGANDQQPAPPDSEAPDKKTVPADEEGEQKTTGEKIREALQDWSNKDQADQDFDDTRV